MVSILRYILLLYVATKLPVRTTDLEWVSRRTTSIGDEASWAEFVFYGVTILVLYISRDIKRSNIAYFLQILFFQQGCEKLLAYEALLAATIYPELLKCFDAHVLWLYCGCQGLNLRHQKDLLHPYFTAPKLNIDATHHTWSPLSCPWQVAVPFAMQVNIRRRRNFISWLFVVLTCLR